MKNQRKTEVHVLGYRIERVCRLNEQGEVDSQWYEVMAPDSDALLGSFAQRSMAEREIIERELAALPRAAA